jgi:hypothetical protein
MESVTCLQTSAKLQQLVVQVLKVLVMSVRVVTVAEVEIAAEVEIVAEAVIAEAADVVTHKNHDREN